MLLIPVFSLPLGFAHFAAVPCILVATFLSVRLRNDGRNLQMTSSGIDRNEGQVR
jgi:hypothetical protein